MRLLEPLTNRDIQDGFPRPDPPIPVRPERSEAESSVRPERSEAKSPIHPERSEAKSKDAPSLLATADLESSAYR